MAEDNVVPFPGSSAAGNVERALIALREGIPSIGVHIDRSAGYGVLYLGGDTVTMIPLEGEPDWFGILVPESTRLRLPWSDGDDFGLDEAASETLTHFLWIANRPAS